MVVRKRGAWLVAKVDGVYVLMSQERTSHIGITAVGARIWDLLDTPQEVDAICAQLRREYAITPEACRGEVDGFLQELAQNGAATFDQAPAA